MNAPYGLRNAASAIHHVAMSMANTSKSFDVVMAAEYPKPHKVNIVKAIAPSPTDTNAGKQPYAAARASGGTMPTFGVAGDR
jgi:hypothetical protein